MSFAGCQINLIDVNFHLKKGLDIFDKNLAGKVQSNKDKGIKVPSLMPIRMSHWCRRVTEGAEIWISCKRPAFLSNFSRLQLIQNSAPSVTRWRQCDIRIAQAIQPISPKFDWYLPGKF